MQERESPRNVKGEAHPLARALLTIGKSGLTGNLVVTSKENSRIVVFLVHKELLMKATGIIPLEFFVGDPLLSNPQKENPYAHELPKIKKLLKKNPFQDVWWWVASQASSTLLGVRSLPGKKKAKFQILDPEEIDETLLHVGAGIRLNRRVVPLFFPDGSRLIEESERSPEGDDWDWEDF